MKRSFEHGKENRDGKDNRKKRLNEPGKGETITFDEPNQSNKTYEVDSDVEMELNVDEGKKKEEGNETARKKKGKTSWVWGHFSIRLSDDQQTEYAHCCYCPRYTTYNFRNGFLLKRYCNLIVASTS